MSIQTYLPVQPYDFQAPEVSWGQIDRFVSPADEIPALAGTLAQLELLLKAPIVDLEVAARLVRSDLGLSIQALRQAWIQSKGSEQPWRISDCVVVLGLRLLDVARPLHCGVKHKFAYSEAEAFWKYASLVATVSEQTATYFDELGVDPEQAYLAGLMHNFNRLPDVLEAVGFLESGESLRLVDCSLPSFVNDVVESTAGDRLPIEMNPLSRVVSFSKRWIDLMFALVGNLHGAADPLPDASAQGGQSYLSISSLRRCRTLNAPDGNTQEVYLRPVGEQASRSLPRSLFSNSAALCRLPAVAVLTLRLEPAEKSNVSSR